MEILAKSTIEQYILPNLSIGLRGKECETELIIEIVSAILYRLKTGCQWRYLPVNQFFSSQPLTWQGVYYHFREWVKDGSWTTVWVSILASNRQFLDLSCMQLDGTGPPVRPYPCKTRWSGSRLPRAKSIKND